MKIRRTTALHAAGGREKWKLLWKTVQQFLTKLNMDLPSDSAGPLLDSSPYPREVKTQAHKQTCVRMYIAALLITANLWKLPRCPSTGEGIDEW